MRKILVAGFSLLIICIGGLSPAVAQPLDQNTVDLFLWGGFGVHAIVINHQNSTANGELTVTSLYGNTTLSFTVPGNTNRMVFSFPFGIYRYVTVTLSVEKQTLVKNGVVIGFFVLLV